MDADYPRVQWGRSGRLAMEMEVKLRLDEAAAKLWQRVLSQQGATRQGLQAVYFDTDPPRLGEVGISLRMRREGRRWLQTVKIRGDGALQRFEHEVAVAGRGTTVPSVDLSRHDGTPAAEPLAKALPKGAQDLKPRFSTEVVRWSRRVSADGGGEVELSVDIGHIRAGDRQEAIAEAEVEAKKGPPTALFKEAASLLREGGAWISSTSKAERGDRLARGSSAGADPIKAQPLSMDRDAGAQTLLRAILLNALQQVLGNVEGIAEGGAEPDQIHQLRVGIRRLRTALRELKFLARGAWQDLETPLSETFALLGQRRDDETVAAAVRPLLIAARAPRSTWETPALPDLQRAVRAASFQTALLQVLEVIYRLEDVNERMSRQALKEQLATRLDKLHRQVVRQGRRFEELEEAKQHRVRKRLKRLRYLCEFVGHLWSGSEVTRYLDSLKPAQEALGRHNDVAVAGNKFRDDAQRHPESWFAAGLLSAQLAVTRRDARKALRQVAKTRPFWRGG